MRLVLKLEAGKDVVQNREYNSKFYTGMHGWIYNKLKNTDFSNIYSDKGFKPFCFSNLFSINNKLIKEGETYRIIISSTNEMLIIALLSQINLGELVNIGEYNFKLVSYKPLQKLKIKKDIILESETITNVTIHKDDKIRAITLSSDTEVFKENLAKNLIRKYNYVLKESISEDFDLFKNIKIEEIKESKKAVKINFIKNSDNWFNIIGARYRFEIGDIDETQKKILELCYDLGFGERNTFGFGFVNTKSKHSEAL